MSGFLTQNWGNLASVAGLAISVWVLIVATKAKQAAQDARSAARLKNFVEVLEDARRSLEQIAIFLKDQKWDLVQLRATEVSGDCRIALERWGDYLSETGENNLVDVATLATSIAGTAAESFVRQLDSGDLYSASQAQIEAAGLISSVLGEAQKSEERTKTEPWSKTKIRSCFSSLLRLRKKGRLPGGPRQSLTNLLAHLRAGLAS